MSRKAPDRENVIGWSNFMRIKFNRIWHLFLTAELPALVCGLVVFFSLQVLITNTNHATENEEQAHRVIKSCAHAQSALLRGLLGCVEYFQSGDSSTLKRYYQTTESLQSIDADLQQVGSAYPAEEAIVAALRKLAACYRDIGDEAIAIRKLGPNFGLWRLSELEVQGQYVFEQWGSLSKLLRQALERDLALSPVGSQSYATTLSGSLLLALVTVWVACIITARTLTRYIDARLATIRDNNQRLAGKLPLHTPLPGSDEIATLDKEFHAMAAAIAEATERERNILENTSDIIITIDEQLKVRSANPACIRIWHDQNIVGESFVTLAPDNAQQTLGDFFERCKQTGYDQSVEVPLISAQGKMMHVSIAGKWSSQDGLFSCLLHDITERKKAEEIVAESERRLRAMLNEMPAGLLLVDQASKIIDCNSNAARLFGTAADQIEDRPVGNLMKEAVGSEIDARWLQRNVGRKHIVVPNSPHAEASHLEVSTDQVNLANGPCFLLIALDITASQKLDRVRNQLIDSISTRIVDPLSSISEVLLELKETYEEQRNASMTESVKTACQETSRLLALFSELLEVQSSNIHQLSIHKEDIGAADLLKRATEATRPLAEKRGIKLACSTTAHRLYVDPDRIVQVLINLVSNAFKFTSAGGYVKVEAEAISSDVLELRVVDSGRGIPEGMEVAIFEPFKQARIADALTKGGSGLGLFICKSIIERHGGMIAARNHADGAEFYIHLPIVKTQ